MTEVSFLLRELFMATSFQIVTGMWFVLQAHFLSAMLLESQLPSTEAKK